MIVQPEANLLAETLKYRRLVADIRMDISTSTHVSTFYKYLTLQNLTRCDFSETSLFETIVVMFPNLSASAFNMLSSTAPQEPKVSTA